MRPSGAELMDPGKLLAQIDDYVQAADTESRPTVPEPVKVLLTKIAAGQCVDERKCCLVLLDWLSQQ